jgi:Flp pilus assembly protein TadG
MIARAYAWMHAYAAKQSIRAFRNQDGQALPFMALSIVLYLGMAGLSLDAGHAFVCYRELQASTDAAALAGAYVLAESNATSASVQAVAQSYSSVSGGVNVNPNLTGVTITTTPKCLTTLANEGVPCSASPTGDNAVVVQQTATVSTYFIQAIKVFGLKPSTLLTLNTVSTAAMRGATNAQINVAIVVDTTASMGDPDPDENCNGTQIQCALEGIQILLNSLTPCSQGSSASTCKSGFDQVALFTFPNVTESTASDDTTCTKSAPTVAAYSTPSITGTTYTPSSSNPSYEITDGFLDDYSATNASKGGLATTSQLGIATGADTGKNCNGLQTPGGEGTYYAGAIYAAQAALVAAQQANPGSQNAMVILTDGDAPGGDNQHTFTNASGGSETLNSDGTYPSMLDECEQAVVAAQAATTAGTTVYTIAYNSPTSGGCSTDTYNKKTNPNGTNIQPCTALQQMASAPADFYSDATPANKGACISTATPGLDLAAVFHSIATSFTVARLIPNGTT